ncbi:MAG: hypothetical protein ACK5Q5_19590, partial [Planctomycetaceae bacterium]
MLEPQSSTAAGREDEVLPTTDARSLTVGDKTISRDLVPVKSRELAVIALLVLLFDLVVYRG